MFLKQHKKVVSSPTSKIKERTVLGRGEATCLGRRRGRSAHAWQIRARRNNPTQAQSYAFRPVQKRIRHRLTEFRCEITV